MIDRHWARLRESPEIDASVEDVRSAITALRRHPANRTGWARTAAVASLRAARASAALDGAPLRMDPDALVVTEPLVAGALRVASSLAAMARVWPRSPLQMLARLHTLAAADLVGADQLGRPRTTDPTVGPGLAELVELVTTSPWPAPVQVAVVHARLMTLRPFHHANGVIARAAARLTMMSTGLDPAGLGVPEVAHLRFSARYGELLVRVADGRPDAEIDWVLEECRCLISGIREGVSIADSIG